MAILSTIKKIKPCIKTAAGYVYLKLFAEDIITKWGTSVQDELSKLFDDYMSKKYYYTSKPLRGAYGDTLNLRGTGGTWDKYFLSVNSSNQFFVGTQLNGDSNITVTRMLDETDAVPELLKSSSVSQGSTIYLPSTNKQKLLIMFGVSNTYNSIVLPKSFRKGGRVTCTYSIDTAITFEFTIKSDTEIYVSRVWKEGAWKTYGTQIEVWAI